MGRNKTPEKTNKLRGNPGKRPIKKATSVSDPSLLTCPPGLSKEETYYWNLYAPYLAKIGKLSVTNIPDLKNLCYLEALIDNIKKTIKKKFPSLTQIELNYHKEEVGIKENIYSKLLRDYLKQTQQIKGYLCIRTDKMHDVPPDKPDSHPEDEFLDD